MVEQEAPLIPRRTCIAGPVWSIHLARERAERVFAVREIYVPANQINSPTPTLEPLLINPASGRATQSSCLSAIP